MSRSNFPLVLVLLTALALPAAACAEGDGQLDSTYDPSSPVYLLANSAALRREVGLTEAQLKSIREMQRSSERSPDAVRARLGEVLEAKQIKRVEEVRLQVRGGTALVLPTVAKEIKLTASQQSDLEAHWKSSVREFEAKLKVVRYPSEKARRTAAVAFFRRAGEPMLQILDEGQQSALKAFQGEPVEIGELYDASK